MKACDAVVSLLAARALGALEDAQAALVDEHLAVCLACRAAAEEARADLDLVDAPPLEPPAGAWDRLERRLAAERAGTDLAQAPGPGVLIAVACAYCRGTVGRPEAVYCASCLAPHHPDCFTTHGRCSVMGCAETRVVRPHERPDVAPAPVALRALPGKGAGGPAGDGQDADGQEPDGRRRWRRAGAALFATLVGAGAAAALAPSQRARPVAPPAVAPAPREAPALGRWDVDVRDASLAELARALEAEAGVEVQLAPRVLDLLVPPGTWREATSEQVVRDVAASLGLRVQPLPSLDGGRGRLALSLSDRADAPPRPTAGATVERGTTVLWTRHTAWSVADLVDGAPHRLVPDRWALPSLPRLAVLDAHGRLDVVVGREVARPRATGAAGTAGLPPLLAVSWTADELLGLGHDGVVRGASPARGRVEAVSVAREAAYLDPAGRVALRGDLRLGPQGAEGMSAFGLRARRAPGGSGSPPAAGRPDPDGFAHAGSVVDAALPAAPDGPAFLLTRDELLRLDGRTVRAIGRFGERTSADAPLPRGAPRQVECSHDGRVVLVRTDEQLGVVDAEGASVGRWPLRRRGRAGAWSAALDPTGARVAWVDEGAAWWAETARPEGGVRGPIGLEGGRPVTHVAWRHDGAELLLATDRGLAVASFDAAGVGGGDASGPTLLAPALELDGVRDVAWHGDAVAVATVRALPRDPRVAVRRAGAPGPAPGPPRVDLQVEIAPHGGAAGARATATPPETRPRGPRPRPRTSSPAPRPWPPAPPRTRSRRPRARRATRSRRPT